MDCVADARNDGLEVGCTGLNKNRPDTWVSETPGKAGQNPANSP